MRWVVELPAPDGGTAATVTVEADSWAGALTNARGGVSIKKFRCEFEDEGVVRVNDLDTRQRYTVRPFRAAAPVVSSSLPPSTPPAARGPSFSVAPPPGSIIQTQRPSAPSHPAIQPDLRTGTPAVETVATVTTAPIVESVAAVTTAPAAETVATVTTAPAAETVATVTTAPAAEPVATVTTAPAAEPERSEPAEAPTYTPRSDSLAPSEPLPVPTVVFERDQEPGPTNPLTYRERVFAVPVGTRVDLAEQLARQALSALKRSLVTRPKGRYVTVAVFDHSFTAHPERPALVVLRWKDWKSDHPEVEHPDSLPWPAAPSSEPNINGSNGHIAQVIEVTVAPAQGASPHVSDSDHAAEIEKEISPVPPREESVVVVEQAAPTPAHEESVVVVEQAAPTPAHEESVVVVEQAAPTPAHEESVVVVEKAASTPREESVVVVEKAASTPHEESVVVETEAHAEDGAEDDSSGSKLADGSKKKKRKRRETKRSNRSVKTAGESGSPAGPGSEKSTRTESLDSTRAEPAPLDTSTPESASAEAEIAQIVSETNAVDARAAAPEVHSSVPVVREAKARKRGHDLLSDLFDALMDLALASDSQHACEFIAKTLHDHLSADAVAIATYDINHDEFVFVAHHGASDAAGRRVRANLGSFGEMLRRRGPVVVGVSEGLDVASGGVMGGPAMVAPGFARERLFAAVHLGRHSGAPRFESDEQDAVAYVAGQLGEYLMGHSRREAVRELANEDAPRRR